MIKSNQWNTNSFLKSLLLIGLLSFAGLICFGQNGDRHPDSISTDQTIESPKDQDTMISGSAHQNGSLADSSDDNTKEQKMGAEDSIQFRAVPDSVVRRMKQDKDFAYANNPAYWIREESENRNDKWFKLVRWFRHNVWVTRFLYLFLGGIVLFAIYVIAIRNRLFVFYSSPRKILGREEEDIVSTGLGLDEKIEAAVQEGNYRLAVRYMYLKTLKTANDKGFIKFTVRKTNQEYVRQLVGNPIAREFGFLTSAYEWTWYGGFEIRPDQFSAIREQYNLLNKKMGH